MNLKFLLFSTALIAAFSALASEDVAKKAGCMACHLADKKMVGPAFRDVAAKYRGQADAAAKLAAKVRNGAQGVWGPVPMPPNPVARISDSDLRIAVQWILKN